MQCNCNESYRTFVYSTHNCNESHRTFVYSTHNCNESHRTFAYSTHNCNESHRTFVYSTHNCNESHRTFVYSTHNYRIKFSICPIFILLQLNYDGVSEKECVTETNATLLYLRNNLILKKLVGINET